MSRYAHIGTYQIDLYEVHIGKFASDLMYKLLRSPSKPGVRVKKVM